MEALKSIIDQDYKDFEIVLVDNNIQMQNSDYVNSIVKKMNDSRIYYYKTSKNLGVSGGRNLGIKKAKGDIFIFLDDDAVFKNKNSFSKILEEFNNNFNTAVLSFKIINYFSQRIERNEFPHRNKKMNPNKKFETSYFIGAGHAIRREIFDKIGVYSEDFFYGMEELDLSFKIIDRGYRLFYFPDVIIYHKKSPKGRLPNKYKWQKILENRIKVSLLNLPLIYVICSIIIWSGIVFIKTIPDLRYIFRAYYNIFKIREDIFKNRKVISDKALSRLRELQGRLCY